MTKKRIAFGWFGGKYSQLNWLLPLLPDRPCYCEPYGGSAAVLLNRAPAPVETYNDLYRDVTTFFRVLRDAPDDLIRAISLTPYSREELGLACQPDKDTDDLERARRFYVRARQTFGGLATTATEGRWSSHRSVSRQGMATTISRWHGGTDKLADVASRLARVQIESRPALYVIQKYDTVDTLTYCDPPYTLTGSQRTGGKGYAHEMTEQDHIDLATVLHACTGSVAISGYRSELYDRLYGDWRRHDHTSNSHTALGYSTGHTPLRAESLWTNYDPADQQHERKEDR